MPSLGELEELLHVSHVSVVAVPTVPVKVLSETCAVVDICLPPPRSIVAGTGR